MPQLRWVPARTSRRASGSAFTVFDRHTASSASVGGSTRLWAISTWSTTYSATGSVRQTEVNSSARSEYAVRRAVLEVAARGPELVKAEVVVARLQLPRKFVESILSDLRRAGLVRSTRRRRRLQPDPAGEPDQRGRRSPGSRRAASRAALAAPTRDNVSRRGRAPARGMDRATRQRPPGPIRDQPAPSTDRPTTPARPTTQREGPTPATPMTQPAPRRIPTAVWIDEYLVNGALRELGPAVQRFRQVSASVSNRRRCCGDTDATAEGSDIRVDRQRHRKGG